MEMKMNSIRKARVQACEGEIHYLLPPPPPPPPPSSSSSSYLFASRARRLQLQVQRGSREHSREIQHLQRDGQDPEDGDRGGAGKKRKGRAGGRRGKEDGGRRGREQGEGKGRGRRTTGRSKRVLRDTGALIIMKVKYNKLERESQSAASRCISPAQKHTHDFAQQAMLESNSACRTSLSTQLAVKDIVATALKGLDCFYLPPLPSPPFLPSSLPLASCLLPPASFPPSLPPSSRPLTSLPPPPSFRLPPPV
eukprot:748504-Hanusia_phi.AAC.4